jgi:hypothetical protein
VFEVSFFAVILPLLSIVIVGATVIVVAGVEAEPAVIDLVT